MATIPAHFRFWILDFRLSEPEDKDGINNLLFTVFSCSLLTAHSSLLTPHDHLITLSALASTLGGIVRPICFAAFRLMTNSNFFGCSTGRSAGFAPFRILST